MLHVLGVLSSPWSLTLLLQAKGMAVSKGSPSPWVCHGWGSTGCPASSLSAWMRAEASGFSPCVLPSPAPSALLGRPHGEVGGPCLRLHSIRRPEPSGTASVPVCLLRSLCHVCPALAPLQGGVPGTGRSDLCDCFEHNCELSRQGGPLCGPQAYMGSTSVRL